MISDDTDSFDAATARAVAAPSPDAARAPRKGARLYLAANFTSQAIALVRYVVLARLIGPEQLGLAATIIVTSTFFDLISDTGADRFLVQDREGDSDRLQRLVQLAFVGRGIITAAALIICAGPLAGLYREPQIAAGFVFLAIAPLAKSFLHLDVRRSQRSFDFRPEAKCIIVSEGIGIVVLVTAAWLARDFTAAIWGLLARSVSFTLMSHVLAKRRYGFGWNKSDGARLIRFAYPLMITGLFLFIGSQGDRVAVARWLGAKPLGLYSAVLLLIYFPSALIINYLSALYIPLVSAERDNPVRRAKVIHHLGGQVFLLSIAMCSGFALVAPLAVTLLYGHRYTQSASLVGLVGVLQCTRALITWPTAVNLALARSRTVLASNIARLLAFPGAYAGAKLLGGLEGMVAGLATGEFAAIAIALVLMNRGAGRPLLSGFERLAAFAGTGLIIIGWDLAIARHAIVLDAAMLIPSAALGLWIARQERDVIAEAIDYARRMAPRLFARFGPAR